MIFSQKSRRFNASADGTAELEDGGVQTESWSRSFLSCFSLFTMHTHTLTHTNELAIAFVNSRRIFQDAFSPIFSLLSPFKALSYCSEFFHKKQKEKKKQPLNDQSRRYILSPNASPFFFSCVILCSIKLPCSRSCADFEFPSIIRSFYSFYICWKEKKKKYMFSWSLVWGTEFSLIHKLFTVKKSTRGFKTLWQSQATSNCLQQSIRKIIKVSLLPLCDCSQIHLYLKEITQNMQLQKCFYMEWWKCLSVRLVLTACSP